MFINEFIGTPRWMGEKCTNELKKNFIFKDPLFIKVSDYLILFNVFLVSWYLF